MPNNYICIRVFGLFYKHPSCGSGIMAIFPTNKGPATYSRDSFFVVINNLFY